MARPNDFDTSRDYRIFVNGALCGYMRANFAEASCAISVAAPGDEWHTTGRQVADFRHDPLLATIDLWADDLSDDDTITVE